MRPEALTGARGDVCCLHPCQVSFAIYWSLITIIPWKHSGAQSLLGMALRSDLLHKTSSLGACSEQDTAKRRGGAAGRAGEEGEPVCMETSARTSLETQTHPKRDPCREEKRETQKWGSTSFLVVLRALGAP